MVFIILTSVAQIELKNCFSHPCKEKCLCFSCLLLNAYMRQEVLINNLLCSLQSVFPALSRSNSLAYEVYCLIMTFNLSNFDILKHELHYLRIVAHHLNYLLIAFHSKSPHHNNKLYWFWYLGKRNLKNVVLVSLNNNQCSITASLAEALCHLD